MPEFPKTASAIILSNIPACMAPSLLPHFKLSSTPAAAHVFVMRRVQGDLEENRHLAPSARLNSVQMGYGFLKDVCGDLQAASLQEDHRKA